MCSYLSTGAKSGRMHPRRVLMGIDQRGVQSEEGAVDGVNIIQ